MDVDRDVVLRESSTQMTHTRDAVSRVPDGCIPDFLTLALLDMAAPSGLSVRDP
jgi:hypothetical protein